MGVVSLQEQPAAPEPDPALDAAAAGDGWWGKWRGVQAWELTIETPVVVICILISVMRGDAFVVDALVKLVPVITIYLTARYAVLGVHVYRGSIERSYGLQTYQQTFQQTLKSSRAD